MRQIVVYLIVFSAAVIIGRERTRRHHRRTRVVPVSQSGPEEISAQQKRTTAALTTTATVPLSDQLHPPPDKAIVLPPIGTLDVAVLQGDRRMTSVRTMALQALSSMARDRCKVLHKNGDTWIRGDLTVSIAGGVVTLKRFSNVVVDHGAPIDQQVVDCMVGLFPPAVELPAPALPANAPPEQKARYTGKWQGVPDAVGEFSAVTAFADQLCAADRVTNGRDASGNR